MTLFFLAAIDRIPWARRSRSSSWGRWAWRSSGPENRRNLIWPVIALGGVLLLTEPWTGAIDWVGGALRGHRGDELGRIHPADAGGRRPLQWDRWARDHDSDRSSGHDVHPACRRRGEHHALGRGSGDRFGVAPAGDSVHAGTAGSAKAHHCSVRHAHRPWSRRSPRCGALCCSPRSRRRPSSWEWCWWSSPESALNARVVRTPIQQRLWL